MKRLVWLLLFAFGNLLAQVPVVDVRLNPGETCSCCDRPGACDMPDCVPAPVSSQAAFESPRTLQTARLAVRRSAPTSRAAREDFYARFQPRPRVAPMAPRLTAASPASVRLFQEHCSLLL